MRTKVVTKTAYIAYFLRSDEKSSSKCDANQIYMFEAKDVQDANELASGYAKLHEKEFSGVYEVYEMQMKRVLRVGLGNHKNNVANNRLSLEDRVVDAKFTQLAAYLFPHRY